MSGSEIPDVLRARPEMHQAAPDLVREARLELAVAERVIRDLLASRLIQRKGESVQYSPADDVRPTVDLLAEMYHTKPVTLVRALYDRPTRSVQSFADAFRLRKGGD